MALGLTMLSFGGMNPMALLQCQKVQEMFGILLLTQPYPLAPTGLKYIRMGHFRKVLIKWSMIKMIP